MHLEFMTIQFAAVPNGVYCRKETCDRWGTRILVLPTMLGVVHSNHRKEGTLELRGD